VRTVHAPSRGERGAERRRIGAAPGVGIDDRAGDVGCERRLVAQQLRTIDRFRP